MPPRSPRSTRPGPASPGRQARLLSLHCGLGRRGASRSREARRGVGLSPLLIRRVYSPLPSPPLPAITTAPAIRALNATTVFSPRGGKEKQTCDETLPLQVAAYAAYICTESTGSPRQVRAGQPRVTLVFLYSINYIAL